MSRRTRGVVAAGDPQTAAAGRALLDQGGNAVDAALAAAFAAFVCELPLCSPLGGGAMLVELPSGSAHALDMFARGPGLGRARPREMDFTDVEVGFGATTQVFHVGRASVAVPLALRGLLEAHRRWGSRPLTDIVEPAVALGRSGYTLGPGVAFVFRVLEPIARLTPACHALFVDERGALAAEGARLRNVDLASTLEAIAREPARVADVYATLADELGPERGGLVTDRDVAEARVVEATPVRVRHGDWDVATMPGPSTGGALVALGLRLHEDAHDALYLSPEHVLTVASVQEVLLEERDPRFDERCRDPSAVAAMLSASNVTRLRARLREKRAGAPSPRKDGESPLGSTTHVSAIDEHGVAASLTLTNGEGSGHVVSGTGMIANNLLGEEDIHPRGFHLDPPGAALSTMMAPTILRRGERRIALGSGGSNRLRNAILQVLVALLEHDVDVERAVRAPRIQIEARGGGARAAFESPGMPDDARDALLAAFPRDAAVFEALNLYFGGVHVAIADGGSFTGAGDPRRGGAIALA